MADNDTNDPRLEGYQPLDHYREIDHDRSSRRIRDMPWGRRKEKGQISPSEMSFGTVDVNGLSAAQTATITNMGYDALPINRITAVGDFVITSDCPPSLAPGASCSVVINFNPKREGIITGGLYLDSGDAAGTEFVKLRGTGELAALFRPGRMLPVWVAADLAALAVPGDIRCVVVGSADGETTLGAHRRRRVASAPAAPASCKTRSLDRMLPDGSISASNGGWWLIDEPAIDVRMTGARLDGVADDTQAIRDAVALGRPVRLPAGRARVTGQIALQSGQRFSGEGETSSVIVVSADFDLAASGVIKMGSGEPGARLEALGIELWNASSTATRAAMIQYPPAIDAYGIPRFVIDRVRITGARIGIDARGNAGGAYIGRVEIGAWENGVRMDGALDFVHGDSWHFWPFGFQDGGTGVGAIYRDGSTVGIELGAVDGLNVSKISCFRCGVDILSRADTLVGRQIANLELDGNGAWLRHAGRNTQIGTVYSTKSSPSPSAPDIYVSGGRLVINSLQMLGSSAGPAILVDGGTAQINGGTLSNSNPAGQVGRVNAGTLIIRDCNIIAGSYLHTSPLIQQVGGGLVVDGVRNTNSAASGPLVGVASDGVANRVRDVTLNGMSTSLPTGALVGCYDIDKWETWTPAPGFTTPGSSTFTISQVDGRFRRGGRTVEWEALLVFDITDLTGASGGFFVGTLPITPVGDTPATISQIGRVGFSSSAFISAEISPNGKIYFRTQDATAGVGTMGPSQFAVRTGYTIRASGSYRI